MHADAALGRYARDVAAAAASSGLCEIDILATITAALAEHNRIDVAFADERAVVHDASALPAVPHDVAPAIVLATARESLLTSAARRRNGAHYTPYGVARRLSAIALDRGPPRVGTICDPAVGGGIFLVAVADELAARGVARADVIDRLWGADVDAVSVAVARTALRLWANTSSDRDDRGLDQRVVVGDPLLCGRPTWPAHDDGFDLVIGNPPFLNQLQRASSRTRDDARLLVARFGDAALGYVDSSALFVLTGLELAAPGGIVLLIQPQSCLSAKDTDGVRRAVDELATLEGLWFCRDRVFGASVRVCAPMVRVASGARDTTGSIDVVRWVDRDVSPVQSVARSANSNGQWSSLIDDLLGIPAVALSEGLTLADIGCRATSGFRDQFYGFVGATHEQADRPGATMRLVTVGMIDPLGSGWGRRTSRFAGRDFLAPVVDRDELDERMRAWADARRGAKLLVATQTKVIEVAVDERGDCAPLTPVIDLRAPDGSLWRVAAALTNPVATAIACSLGAGSALALDAIKLSARQLLRLPVPVDDELWERGAEVAEAAAAATGDRAALWRELAETMCRAYGQPAEPLTSWWLGRLPKRP